MAITKQRAATKIQQTLKNLPSRTRIALGKESAAVQRAVSRAS
jgi:hypothetical protein